MAEPSPTLPSLPSVQSDVASESFIVPSDSLASAVSPISRPQSPAGEKQGLLEALDRAHKALDNARSENDDLKEQLVASQRQVQDQSDQIAMLRGKVEEARRGVMRLQTENRRHSQLATAASPQEVRTAKRASFILPPTPASPGGLTPGGGKHIHRRISSMSDPGYHNDLRMTASPPSFATSFPEAISGPVTPPQPAGPSAEEFAKLRAELAACQQSLLEATDAREASETAVRCLRQFIAENAVGESKSSTEGACEGLQGLRLPPLPTDVDVADSEASAPQKTEEPKRGWGSWLKRETSNTSTSKPAPTAVPALSIRSSSEDDAAPSTTPATTPLTNFVSSWTRSVSSSAESSPATAPEPAPAQQSAFRKFSLFNRSSSNTASNPPSQTQTQYEAEPEQEEAKHIPPPLQLHREGSVRDSISSASVSDAPEPISPPVELVDIALDRDRHFIGKEEYTGERTPTVGNATGFAM